MCACLFFYQAIQSVLWNEDAGAWFDYDLINQKPRPYFVTTNLSPLVFGCYKTSDKSAIARKILAYIDATGIDAFPGGVPTTLMQTGEQWDYPNAWAPLQHWLAEGLRTLDDKNATELANKWTRRWTLSNYIAYKETKAMFEKVRVLNFHSFYIFAGKIRFNSTNFNRNYQTNNKKQHENVHTQKNIFFSIFKTVFGRYVGWTWRWRRI